MPKARQLWEGGPGIPSQACSAGPTGQHHVVIRLSSHCPIPPPCCRDGQQKVADVFLAREQGFDHHATHILQFDRSLSLLSESCLHCPRLAAAVREFEVGPWVPPEPALRMQGQVGTEGLDVSQCGF